MTQLCGMLSIGLGAICSCITDGISIGHPCCAVHNCPNPLVMKKGVRYCQEHQIQEDHCSVLSCKSKASPGFRTCAKPTYRRLEDYLCLENKAMFQLKRHHERLHAESKTTNHIPTTFVACLQLEQLISDTTSTTPQVSDSLVNSEQFFESLDHILDNGEIECEAEKAVSGNKCHCAQFGRCRTHNEELMVASCGVIIGRATFFGSEAINGVVVSLRISYLPPVSDATPG